MRVFQDPEIPALAGLFVDVENLEALQKLMASPEVEAAKAEVGVKSDTMKILGEITL